MDMPPATDSLSTSSPPRTPKSTEDIISDPLLRHAPNLQPITTKQEPDIQPCNVKPLSLDVKDNRPGSVAGFLHVPQRYGREETEGREKTAAILLSGASGGVVGPSGIYLSIADKLASLRRGLPVLRLDYRYPARNGYCVRDVEAAMRYLETGGISRFVLVGWSFGGAPVFTVGGKDERVVGCATVASQTAETNGVSGVAKRNVPVLLMHGTADGTLSLRCSERLRDEYGCSSNGGDVELKLFKGDDHALTRNSLEAEKLICQFVARCAGFDIVEKEQKEVFNKQLVPEDKKVEIMKKAGDADKPESVK